MDTPSSLTRLVNATKLILRIGDITAQDTAAIVNAANSSLLGGGGVDGAIHRAGGPGILAECRQIVSRIGFLAPGRAVITSAGDLPAKYVIHTVGPVWQGGGKQEDAVLADAYRASLSLARQYGITSIAFPSISTGAYRFPVERAASVALALVLQVLSADAWFTEVRLVLWSREDFEVYAAVLGRARIFTENS
jgi:O-acetyl-ADP-ribose deacetylase (regulator of RNase III)